MAKSKANSLRNAWLKQHAAGEAALSRVLNRYFSAQTKRILAALADYKNPTAATVGKVFDEKAEHKLLMKAVSDPLIGFMATGAANVIAQQKKKSAKAFSFDGYGLPKHLQQAIREAFELLEEQDYWQEIQATTADRLAAILKQAIEDGLNGHKLTKKLRESLGAMSKVRSKAIARTETTLAYNQGHQLSYETLAEDGLIEGKQWLAVIDGDTRESHASANGQTVEADQKFDLGGNKCNFPGDVSLPAKHRVNCRCTTVAVFGDE